MKKYFQNRKLIYSEQFEPAELVKYHRYKGKAYVRIAFTNKVLYPCLLYTSDAADD